MSKDLRITDIRAFPTSFPIPPENRVALGIGTAIKRDAVVVKITTAGGLWAGASRTTAAPTPRWPS